MTQQPGLPPDSDALPSPTSAHQRDLDAVVAGGAKRPAARPTHDHQWYEWPFAAEVWIMAISLAALVIATLFFGGAGFAVVFWVAAIFWFGYGLIYKIMMGR